MQYKEAIAVLTNLLDKYPLDAEEKEAVITAIGVLDCAKLADGILERKIKARKTKREKSLE